MRTVAGIILGLLIVAFVGLMGLANEEALYDMHWGIVKIYRNQQRMDQAESWLRRSESNILSVFSGSAPGLLGEAAANLGEAAEILDDLLVDIADEEFLRAVTDMNSSTKRLTGHFKGVSGFYSKSWQWETWEDIDSLQHSLVELQRAVNPQSKEKSELLGLAMYCMAKLNFTAVDTFNLRAAKKDFYEPAYYIKLLAEALQEFGKLAKTEAEKKALAASLKAFDVIKANFLEVAELKTKAVHAADGVYEELNILFGWFRQCRERSDRLLLDLSINYSDTRQAYVISIGIGLALEALLIFLLLRGRRKKNTA